MTQVRGEHLRGQAQLELRLRALEQRQSGQDAELRKRGSRQDRELLFPCVAAKTVEGACDLLERLRRDEEEVFAFFRERDRAMQPMKQLQIHGVFKKADRRLTAACVTPSSSAASVKLLSRATASKSTNAFSEGIRRRYPFISRASNFLRGPA